MSEVVRLREHCLHAGGVSAETGVLKNCACTLQIRGTRCELVSVEEVPCLFGCALMVFKMHPQWVRVSLPGALRRRWLMCEKREEVLPV